MTSLLLQVFLLAPAVLALLLVRKPYINTRLYYAHTEEIVSDLPEYDGRYAPYLRGAVLSLPLACCWIVVATALLWLA
jgi:hypothetical protein